MNGSSLSFTLWQNHEVVSESRYPRPSATQQWWFLKLTRSGEITRLSIVLFLGQKKKYDLVIHTLFINGTCYRKTNSHLIIKQSCLNVLTETSFHT